jgi:hypothetical protein
MWLYLWDLVDEGYGLVLTRLKDHGLTSVSLATSYHAGRFLAPHNPARKVVFLEDGTVYFKAANHLYGRITPIENSLVKEGHGLQRLRKAADEAGMETRAWVVCCHNTALGTRHQDCIVQNAFGDRMLHSLCPANRHVRSYLRTLVRDVAATGVSRVELEAFAFPDYGHGFHHERDGIPLTDAVRLLLSLCFCPACIEQATAAGVAAESLRTSIRQMLERYFSAPDGDPGPLTSIEALTTDTLSTFLQWRISCITELVQELVSAPYPLGTMIRPIVSLDPSARRAAGVDIASIAGVTGGVLVPGYVRDGERLRGLLRTLLPELQGSEVTVGLQVGLPESGGREEFLGRLFAAREAGITSFNFYNYGLISLDRLEWVRDGLTR